MSFGRLAREYGTLLTACLIDHPRNSPQPNTQFKWSAMNYEVFGAGPFENGALVIDQTNRAAIQPGWRRVSGDPTSTTHYTLSKGQTATLSSQGVMLGVSGQPNSNSPFTVQNLYRSINIAAASYVNGSYATAYVSPSPVLQPGTISFTPGETVAVLFSAGVVAPGMMFADATKNVLEASSMTVRGILLTFSHRFPSILRIRPVLSRTPTRSSGSWTEDNP